MDDDIYC